MNLRRPTITSRGLEQVIDSRHSTRGGVDVTAINRKNEETAVSVLEKVLKKPNWETRILGLAAKHGALGAMNSMSALKRIADLAARVDALEGGDPSQRNATPYVTRDFPVGGDQRARYRYDPSDGSWNLVR